MIFLQLRSGNSGPVFQGTNQNDTLLWDTTERKFFVGPGGGGGAVSSVFGRTGVVVAVSGDYDSDEVDNASSIAGASVSDALEHLGTSDGIANDSSVAGASVSDALDTLLVASGAVTSVFGRLGAVVATLNDYATSQVNNNSSVPGATASDALATLSHSDGITNDSSVAGTTVSDALDTLLAGGGGVITSVFGRIGVVAATLNDYAASLVNNDSSVAGGTVKLALQTLAGQIAGLTTGVSSVFGRVGAVTAAANDYTASQISGSTLTTGAALTDADQVLATPERYVMLAGVASVARLKTSTPGASPTAFVYEIGTQGFNVTLRNGGPNGGDVIVVAGTKMQAWGVSDGTDITWGPVMPLVAEPTL